MFIQCFLSICKIQFFATCFLRIILTLDRKYIDDLTVSEILRKHENSEMKAVLSAVNQWSERNLLDINCTKTKEALFGSLKCSGIESTYLCDVET